MKVKVKFASLRDSMYLGALRKLGSCTDYKGTKVAYDVGRIVKEILKVEMPAMMELEAELVKKYAELDENGEIKFFEENKYKILDGKEEEFAEKRKEFYQTEVEVQRNRIPLHDLECVSLSALELAALEDIICDVELKVAPTPDKVEA